MFHKTSYSQRKVLVYRKMYLNLYLCISFQDRIDISSGTFQIYDKVCIEKSCLSGIVHVHTKTQLAVISSICSFINIH